MYVENYLPRLLLLVDIPDCVNTRNVYRVSRQELITSAINSTRSGNNTPLNHFLFIDFQSTQETIRQLILEGFPHLRAGKTVIFPRELAHEDGKHVFDS